MIYKNFLSLLSLCEGNPPVTGGFPSQTDINGDIWNVFFAESLNSLLNKLSQFPVISYVIMLLNTTGLTIAI